MKCFKALRRLRQGSTAFMASLSSFSAIAWAGPGALLHRTFRGRVNVVSCAGGYNSAYCQFIYAVIAGISPAGSARTTSASRNKSRPQRQHLPRSLHSLVRDANFRAARVSNEIEARHRHAPRRTLRRKPPACLARPRHKSRR